MERCSVCVLPLHLVKHNRENVCIHCQKFKRVESAHWEERRQILHSIIQSYQGRGEKYDFFVPITGGKDSTYVLYYLTRVLGVSRILAFTWDHLFHREASWTNMKKAIGATGVDFVVYEILDRETTRAVHRGFFGEFGHTCIICFTLQAVLIMNQAIRHRIPLIITGRNPGQAYVVGSHHKPGVRSPKEETYRFSLLAYLLRKAVGDEIPEKAGEILEECLGNIQQALQRQDFPWPQYLDLGAFLDWYDQEESCFLKTLGDAFGFQKPSNTFTRTSCKIERLRGYQESNIAKIDKTGYASEMSHFVRSGVLSRQAALLEMEKLGMTPFFPEEAQIYTSTLGLSMEEFEKGLRRPLPFSVRAQYARSSAIRALKGLWPKKG